jgi:hypothetical protein
LLAEKLGVGKGLKHKYYSEHGGNQPGRLFDEAARRVSRGENEVAVVCGGEALASCEYDFSVLFGRLWTWGLGYRGVVFDTGLPCAHKDTGLLLSVFFSFPLWLQKEISYQELEQVQQSKKIHAQSNKLP